MSETMAICLYGVGKMYKIYPTRLDNFLDALGLAWLTPWRQIKPREFWALRDINLSLKKGSRLGIIGRNGAGKSTLLKLITGNLPPTEGRIQVNGHVQALLEAGTGFHPEFTGYENARASLIYQGLRPAEIETALAEIAEFTELGEFLQQPFKTYSAGMQARLVFATATTLKPDILIVDEILGAGDAYFASKSNERMKQLVMESGASVLLVSHALSTILQFCDEAIWIERGRIVQHGPSIEVANAYEGFIHTLDERRLRAKNGKLRTKMVPSFQLDNYTDALSLAFVLQGEQGATSDIARVQLLQNGQVEDEVRVGDVQDSTPAFSAFLPLEGSQWSEPQHTADGYYRTLAITNSSRTAIGYVVFYSFGLEQEATYALRVRYRHRLSGCLSLTVTRNGMVLHNQFALPAGAAAWIEHEVSLSLGNACSMPPSSPTSATLAPGRTSTNKDGQQPGPAAVITAALPQKSTKAVRWPSEGSLIIERVVTLGEGGREQAVFPAGSSMTVCLAVVAQRHGHFHLVPSVTLQRLDGVLISNFVGQAIALDLVRGECREFRMSLPKLLLGDGDYRFSSSIFEKTVSESSRYDLVVHACEFKVTHNDPLVAGVAVQHPATAWVML